MKTLTRPLQPFAVLYAPVFEAVKDHLAPCRDHRSIVLDLGCGDGEGAKLLGASGFAVAAVDRDLTRMGGEERGDRPVRYLASDVHRLPLRDNSVGGLVSVSVLQYVDVRRVLEECHRVLTPQGRGVFVVNLRDNPVVMPYRLVRRLAWKWPSGRLLGRISVDDRPVRHLSWHERAEFLRSFSSVDATALHLTTPLVLAVVVLAPRLGSRHRKRLERVYTALERFDRMLLTRTPGLARFCWCGVIRVTK